MACDVGVLTSRHDTCPDRIKVIHLNGTTTLNDENSFLAEAFLAGSRANCEISVEADA
jgi:hypothetical protein